MALARYVWRMHGQTDHRSLIVDQANPSPPGLVYDAGDIRRAEFLPNGMLKAPAAITRIGVFVYRLADGSERRELRLPEEVFSEDSLQSLALAPLTREHPEPLGTPVTTDNAKELVIGSLGDTIEREGDHVIANLRIDNALAIAEAKSGSRRELSAGYRRDLDPTPGVWNGIPYDGIQRQIRYNHVALTRSGRAGPDAQVRLDSGSAVMVDTASPTEPATDKEPRAMIKITVDGITYEVESDSLAQAVTKAITDRDTKLESLDSQLTDARKAIDEQKARADTLEVERTKLQEQVTDSDKPERIQDFVDARLRLERTAEPLLNVDTTEANRVDITALTDKEIKERVILLADSKADLTDVSEDYLNGRFEGAVGILSTDTSKDARKRAAETRTPPSGGAGAGSTDADEIFLRLRRDELVEDSELEELAKSSPAEAARARMIRDTHAASRKPLGSDK